MSPQIGQFSRNLHKMPALEATQASASAEHSRRIALWGGSKGTCRARASQTALASCSLGAAVQGVAVDP